MIDEIVRSSPRARYTSTATIITLYRR